MVYWSTCRRSIVTSASTPLKFVLLSLYSFVGGPLQDIKRKKAFINDSVVTCEILGNFKMNCS